MDLTRGEKTDLKQALDLLVHNKQQACDVLIYLYLKFDLKNKDWQERFKYWQKREKEGRKTGRIISPFEH